MTTDKSKIDDEESLAPTLRPPPTISERPTVKAPAMPTNIIVKAPKTFRYQFYIIGLIIVSIVITALFLIARPLMSSPMPLRSIYNLSPIVIPNDPKPANSGPTVAPITQPLNSALPVQPKKPIIYRPLTDPGRDYGI